MLHNKQICFQYLYTQNKHDNYETDPGNMTQSHPVLDMMLVCYMMYSTPPAPGHDNVKYTLTCVT